MIKNYKVIRKDKANYGEDSLLTDKVIEVIEFHHNFDIQFIELHKRENGFEVDAVIWALTKEKNLERCIGIELKDRDLYKAIEQAVERRQYYHYFYIVTGNYPSFAFVHSQYPKLAEHGIGVIYSNPKYEIASLLQPSNYIHPKYFQKRLIGFLNIL